MADVRAVKSGVWSDTTVWNTGALPTASDDVWANTFTVTIDISPTVLSIRNGSTTNVTAGGSFAISANGITLRANVIAGGVNCLAVSVGAGNSASVIGNCTGATGTNTYGVLLSGAGTLSISGDCTGGSGGNNHGVGSTSSGTLNVTGTCRGGSFTSHGVALAGSGVININGNCLASGSGCCGAVISTGGSMNITGNCVGGTGNGAIGAVCNGSGVLTITGNCTGGSNSGAHGALNSSTGTINITGDCTSSSGAGAANTGAGTVNITGTCTGATSNNGGAFNSGAGTVNVTGTVIGGASYGAQNSGTGTLSHVGTAQASATSPAIGPGAVGQVTTLTGPLISTSTDQGSAAASGVNPCVALRWFPQDTALGTFELRMRGQTVSGGARPVRQFFFPDAYSATYPAASNVRSSTTYGPGSIYTGSCAVPSAASVLTGVPVDATTGTASAAFTAAGVRSAVGLSAANLDSQLSTLATNTAPATIATAVRTELSPELARAANVATTQEVAEMVEDAV